MSGEGSKRSGEIGEILAERLLSGMGWSAAMKTVSVDCTNSAHTGDSGKPKRTHGDDQILLYDNPFYDGITDVVHVSVKHKTGGYKSTDQAVRDELKTHLLELNEIVSCAKYSPKIREVEKSFVGKPKKKHFGLLVWLHSDLATLDRDISDFVRVTRIPEEVIHPLYFIDSGRASFIVKAIYHFKANFSSQFDFYFPQTTVLTGSSQRRHGKFMPLELISADLLPLRYETEGNKRLCIYSRQNFSESSYLKIADLALDLAADWVSDISIGFPDFNYSSHEGAVQRVHIAYGDRDVKFTPFSMNFSLLNLLEDSDDQKSAV